MRGYSNALRESTARSQHSWVANGRGLGTNGKNVKNTPEYPDHTTAASKGNGGRRPSWTSPVHGSWPGSSYSEAEQSVGNLTPGGSRWRQAQEPLGLGGS